MYGLTSDDADPNTLHLVQLAASAGGTVAGSRWEEDRLPGQSFALSKHGISGPAPPSLATTNVNTDDGARLLLQRALISKASTESFLQNRLTPQLLKGQPRGSAGYPGSTR
jgi:hypothetical protein